jgi:hypothetical protein
MVLATLCVIVLFLLVRLILLIILGHRRSLAYMAIPVLCGCVGVCFFLLGVHEELQKTASWDLFGSKLAILTSVHLLHVCYMFASAEFALMRDIERGDLVSYCQQPR